MEKIAQGVATPEPKDAARIKFEKEIVPALWGTFIGDPSELLDRKLRAMASLVERKNNGYYRNIAVATAYFGFCCGLDEAKKLLEPQSAKTVSQGSREGRYMRTFLVILLLSGICSADQWEFFHPESVISFSCTVSEMDLRENGRNVRRDAFTAQAKAKRRGEGDWEMTIGMFAANIKGRHEAEKVCSKWMDQASKLVRKAQ